MKANYRLLGIGLVMSAFAIPSAAQDTASPATAAQDQAAIAPPAAMPALQTKTGTIGAPPAGQGQIVFYRPGSIMGAALGCTVHEGDQQLARLGSGKYYVVTAAPGQHAYFTEGEAKDVINLEVESDETYFVKCNIGMGIVAGRANLSPSDRETFAKKAHGLSMWKPKDKDA